MIFGKKKRVPARMVRPGFGELTFFDEAQFAADLDTCAPNKHIAIFKRALETADVNLFDRFKLGESAQQLIRQRSALIDRLLYYAWQQYQWDDKILLLAVGGYGRGEMYPHSDIDLLFLTEKDNHETYRESITGFTTLLWDLQLKIGHAVRTPKQCAKLCQSDVTIITNLIECRSIVGNDRLRDELETLIAADKVWSAKDFFVAKLKEQETRHSRHGVVEYDLEPNIKESPGGLRDIQTLEWITKRMRGRSGLISAGESGLYTEQEYNTLRKAEGFLSAARFGLHCIVDRPQDQLHFDTQRQLAEIFAYQDNRQRLAVETFMQDYYRTVTQVRAINDVLMKTISDQLLGECAESSQRINPRFNQCCGLLEASSDTLFVETPSALLEIFVLMSRDVNITGVTASTIRQIRESRYLIDDQFQADPANRTLFLDIFRSQDNLSLALQLMSRYGILARYIPAFGKITGLTQHDLFHIYPVDIHTLKLMNNILSFGLPEARKQFPITADVYENHDRPDLLLLAGLFHDIAKGRGGDHSELGAVDVINFAEQHELPKEDGELLAWLVRNHLLMSSISQREDLSDPEVIARFANHVGNENRLDALYVLTVADINATNPTLWSSWRASLMRQLYTETTRMLRRGLDNYPNRAEVIADTTRLAVEKLSDNPERQASALRHLEALPDNYFLKESSDDIAWHMKKAWEFEQSGDDVVVVRPFKRHKRNALPNLW